jgi:hypothetical protein
MLNNILFLSHGVQIVMLFFLVGLVLVFMKLSNFEKKLKQLEESQSKYISYEDYMESFNNMWDFKMQGKSVSPFPQSTLPTESET